MKKLLIVFIVLVIFFCVFFLEGFTYYWFLPPELNMVLELWKNRPPESEYGYYYAIVSDSKGTTSFLKPVPYEDVRAVSTDIKIGEIWIGPSGKTYIAIAPASKETGAYQIDCRLNSTLVLLEN